MMRACLHHSKLTLLLLTVAWLGGCATTSPTVDYYTLTSDTALRAEANPAANCRDHPVGIGPVYWPKYLRQPQIVTRTGPNRLAFDEFHRWAGSLEDDFLQALRDDLSYLLQSDRVVNYRTRDRFDSGYRVGLDVQQFDGTPGSTVTLEVLWGIAEQQSNEELVIRNARIEQAVAGEDYEAYVRAKSQAIAELSRQIAGELIKLCGAKQD